MWASEVHEAMVLTGRVQSDGDWTQQDYNTLRDSIVIDGVAYPRHRLREIIRERHGLASALAVARDEAERVAEENVRLKLENDQIREKLRRNAVHLQLRTAALTRLVAKS